MITEIHDGTRWIRVDPGTVIEGQRYRMRRGNKLHVCGFWRGRVWSKSGDSWKKVVWDKNAGNFGGYILEAKFSEAPDFIAAQQHAIDGLDDLHTLFVNQKELEFLNRIVT